MQGGLLHQLLWRLGPVSGLGAEHVWHVPIVLYAWLPIPGYVVGTAAASATACAIAAAAAASASSTACA